MPWLACLYVNEPYRGKGLAGQLLQHGLEQARLKGFPLLYLYTDLEGFYEKKWWNNMGYGYTTSDDKYRIYMKSTA
jgi:GNAT superfamily N-acetyltransferase